MNKVREWFQRIRWRMSFEYRMSQEGEAVRQRWLGETDPWPDDELVDERGVDDR